jgi:hypothetical protein
MLKKYSLEWWQSLPPEKVGNANEALVEKLFTQWNESAKFSWHRLPDAKAGRGHVAAQPADYVWWRAPYGGYLEAKACGHEYRLPKDKVRQLPLLQKHALAGADNIVLVHHYMQGVWRAVRAGDLEFGVPSWDLRVFPTYPSAEEALISTGMF